MKFALSTVTALLLAENSLAFMGNSWHSSPLRQSTFRNMADMPIPPTQQSTSSDLPVLQSNSYGQPSEIRYSDFLKLVNADRVEKVTFSADGTQLLGVDVDGARLKMEALPNDPDLLTQLTKHKVGLVCVFLFFLFVLSFSLSFAYHLFVYCI